ncbi:MAG TPA: response regulator [Rectinemataceae bacterium]|nr:response regulator [Rectinemataceae bacterium]
MSINRMDFVSNYLDETRENLRRVDDGVLKLERDPENPEELGAILRALHTIKGSSRMLKFRAMEQLAHGTESVFKGIREKRYAFSNLHARLVFFGGKLLRVGLEAISRTGIDEVDTSAYLAACEQASADEPFGDRLEELQAASLGGEAGRQAGGDSVPGGRAADEGAAVAPDRGESARPGSEQGPAPGYESVRVRLENVTRIVEVLNALIIRQFQFKRFQQDLGSLELGFAELLAQVRADDRDGGLSGKGLPASLTTAQGMLTSIRNMKKGFAEQMAVLEQNSYALQEQVMKLSMLPLDLVLGELPRMAAETAASLGKEIEFLVSGSELLLDKAILEGLGDPLLHLVRNSVDHGIESPSERVAAGKPPAGKISVTCGSEAGAIVIKVADDGRGIDADLVKRRAVERGLLRESDAAALAEGEVFALLFESGFSTKEAVSDLSGRGIGLDIVKHNVDRVKGKVVVRSTKGAGSEFVLSVPISLATVSGFFVLAGGRKFLVPSNFVQKIVRLAVSERVSYFNREAFNLDGKIVTLYSLATLLGLKPLNHGNFLYVVIVESMGERIGVVVDEVQRHASLIFRPVPRNLRKQKIVQGIVFDESYRIINILFVPELIARFKRMKSIDLVAGVRGDEPRSPRALVVDDSANTREIEKSILELEGYEVECAEDGIEALELLKEKDFDVILSDIEMPRMDGITMIGNIRKDAAHARTPIVVVTSYADEATKARAREAGADAHVIKAEFDRNGLVKTIEELLEARRGGGE